MTTLEKVHAVIDRDVRPLLRDHGGDLRVIGIEGDCLQVAFLGACRGCPGAQMTMEDLVSLKVTESVPEIKKVVLKSDVSEDMIHFAKKILNGGATCTNTK